MQCLTNVKNKYYENFKENPKLAIIDVAKDSVEVEGEKLVVEINFFQSLQPLDEENLANFDLEKITELDDGNCHDQNMTSEDDEGISGIPKFTVLDQDIYLLQWTEYRNCTKKNL